MIFVRYIYFAFMVFGSMLRLLNLQFINKNIEIFVYLIYYATAIGATITFYIYEIKKQDMIVFLFYPVLMALSIVPYETIFLLLIIVPIVLKYKYKFKRIIISYWGVSIFIGSLAIFIVIVFGGFGKDIVLASKYSANKEYRIDVIDSDLGALGGDTYIRLYRIYFNTFQRYNRNIYHGAYGENPSIEWMDNEKVKVNGDKIINIKKSPLYENEIIKQ
jgi:hypothetical protein